MREETEMNASMLAVGPLIALVIAIALGKAFGSF